MFQTFSSVETREAQAWHRHCPGPTEAAELYGARPGGVLNHEPRFGIEPLNTSPELQEQRHVTVRSIWAKTVDIFGSISNGDEGPFRRAEASSRYTLTRRKCCST